MSDSTIPLSFAKWIWPGSSMYLINHFANFRKDFKLDLLPETAPFFITADQAYRLYVNGKYVCRGPARGYQSHWPYDEIDASQYLQPGHNWIAVEAYNPGISTFKYIHETCAGFICAAEWDDFCLYSDDSWLKRRSEAHRIDTARYSQQLDFQEHVDTAEADRTWIYSKIPPDDWKENWISPIGYLDNFAFGRSPYYAMEERGIPMLRENIIPPEKAIASVTGKSGNDYRNWQNIVWPFVEESSKSSWLPGSGINVQILDESLEFAILPVIQGEFSATVLAMPEYSVGTVNVMISSEESMEGGILDFIFSEQFQDGKPVISSNGEMCEGAFGNRLLLVGKDINHEFFHIQGFRFITVVARDITTSIRLKLNVRIAEYPFSMEGNFACSDQLLNDIYKICRKTQQICSGDSYVDTPCREQTQWWGDARVQGKNTFYLDGDVRLFKRGIRQIAHQSTPEGLTFGHAPTCAHNCILPDYSLTWIMTLWDYYWQTGDITLFEEQWLRIERVLDYFKSTRIRDASGLLLHDTRFWYFGDWADLYKGNGTPTLLNLYYLQAIEKIAAMLRIAQRKMLAATFDDEICELRKLVIDKLYDPEVNLFRDGIEADGILVQRFSIHEQTMAILLGLKPEAEDNMIQQRLLPFIKQDDVSEYAIPSPFWATYVFEVLSQKGYKQEVLTYIKDNWLPMLATGTTWENFTTELSVAHAWTAHPSFHFVNIITGVTQTASEWRKIQIKPFFPDEYNHASTIIPTPRGNVSVKWEKTAAASVSMDIVIPGGIQAKMIVGNYSEIIEGPAKIVKKDLKNNKTSND